MGRFEVRRILPHKLSLLRERRRPIWSAHTAKVFDADKVFDAEIRGHTDQFMVKFQQEVLSISRVCASPAPAKYFCSASLNTAPAAAASAAQANSVMHERNLR